MALVSTVYVAIGNSDDKLPQADWVTFSLYVEERIRLYAQEVHGAWYSHPTSPWQNACFCFTITPVRATLLRGELTAQRALFKQDSVAWTNACETEFI